MDKKHPVFIIDDDARFGRTLADILRLKGYAPRAFSQSEAALHDIETQHPAVVLIDLRLDRLSGLEVLKQVKALSPDTECIVLTGHASQASAIEAINAGAYGYVLKPYDVEQLLVMIHRAVEKHLAHAYLLKSEERYRSLVETMNDGLASLDKDAVVTFVNRRFCQMLGYTEDEIIGRSVFSFLDEANQESFKNFSRRRERGQLVPYELWITRKDGQPMALLLSPSTLFDAEGTYAGSMAVFTDITEHKQAEEALRQSEVKYRTLYEEVNAARQRLEHLSRRLVKVQEQERRHLAMELHDEIGQLLTGLKLSLETMDLTAPTKAQPRLDMARDITENLVSRVRNLSLQLRPAMLDDFGLLPTLLWHTKRYTAQTDIQVDLQQVGLSKNRLPAEVETTAYRIIQETLTNAARYAGVDRVTIRLTLQDQTLHIKVQDAGAGFDPEPILKAHDTGGLSGIRERAKLVGGEVEITAAPGKGTCITAILPCLEGERV